MNVRTALKWQLAIFALCVAVSAWYSTRLPDIVPTHWDISGHPNAYGSKWVNLLIMPGVVLFTTLLTLVLPLLSPKDFEVTRSGKAYGEVMVLVTALMAMLHAVILAGTTGAKIDMSKWMFGVIFAFFALTGNLLGKIKRNFYMGIRTPWTLADERVWTETHRQCAHQWFALGILGAILVFVGVPVAIMVPYMIVMALLPVVSSYFIYRRIVGR
jgi:uncharacterized membrane protein